MSTILIIEDDGRFLHSCVGLLQRAGYQTLSARDGAEALRLLRTHQTDVVLTDALMPGMDGLETIVMLKQEHPQLRVVAMSGGGEIAARDCLDMCRQLGVTTTLQKPFTQEELLGAIIEAMRGSPPGR